MRAATYLFTALMFFASPVLADTQQLLQLIDYVGADYSDAVIDGDIVNQAEYDEMLDFSAGITQHLADLPDHSVKAGLIDNAQL
ncbi:MAG: iron permease, partial [Gammaproteobacteria bacterium]|nr:iron permease [Gammaproteobacteria bacterium]